MVSLIGKTKINKGPEIKAKLDKSRYLASIKVLSEEMKQINLHKDIFRSEWNYGIKVD